MRFSVRNILRKFFRPLKLKKMKYLFIKKAHGSAPCQKSGRENVIGSLPIHNKNPRGSRPVGHAVR